MEKGVEVIVQTLRQQTASKESSVEFQDLMARQVGWELPVSLESPVWTVQGAWMDCPEHRDSLDGPYKE